MAGTAIENIPAKWDDARDADYFRITAQLFDSEFCFGASVLLASYDDECAPPIVTPESREQPGCRVIPVTTVNQVL